MSVSFRCPMCDNNVQPLLRLITTPSIQCSQCKLRLNVTREMVVANWMRNLYFWGILVIWVGMAFLMMATTGAEAGNPAEAVAMLVVVLLVGWFPGLLFAMPLVFVGMIIGSILGDRLCAERERPVFPDRWGNGNVPKDQDWR